MPAALYFPTPQNSRRMAHADQHCRLLIVVRNGVPSGRLMGVKCWDPERRVAVGVGLAI